MLGISFAQLAVVTIHVTASWCAEGTNHFNTTEPFFGGGHILLKVDLWGKKGDLQLNYGPKYSTFSHWIMIPNIQIFTLNYDPKYSPFSHFHIELWSQMGPNIHYIEHLNIQYLNIQYSLFNIHYIELCSQMGQNIQPFHIFSHQLPKSQSFCHSDSFQLKEQWQIYWKLKISFAVTKLPGQYGQELWTIFPVAWTIFWEWLIVFPRIMDNISIFLGNISKNYGYYFQE